MSRYYFDIDDGVEIRDDVGRDLATPGDVRREALMVATRLLAEEAEDSKETTLILTVRDETGARRLRIRLVSQVQEI